ncbi:MAG: hypothetical protein J7494_12010 [Sphingobium sp.]|nr:hypothetical protein [Sphingobium sp.]
MTRRFAPSPAMTRLLLLAIWAAVCAALLIIDWHFVGPMHFRDPDDALRLVQVRDLLAGQSWFDLTQHRIHPPEGVPMHWSRLVDLPLALVLMALKPLLGAGIAERTTMVVVPLLQLMALMAIVHAIARQLGLRAGTALLAVAMLGTSLSILIQFAPMRIDHHGSQIIYGALAMLALVSTARRDGTMGLLAGVAMACWMQVSIEGLPCAVAMGAVFGVRHLLRVDRWADMRAYLLTLTGASALLLFGTHYPSDALIFWCDSMSPAYLAPLAAASFALYVGALPMHRNSIVSRALPLALGGLAGAAAFLLAGRQCLAGPFETLDPIVYQNWYLSVKEGLPVTAQAPDIRAMIVLPTLLGFVGSWLGWRRNQSPEQRMAWASLIAMQGVTFLISLDVMRAMSFAHLLALPGNAMLLIRLITAAQRLRTMPLRVLLSAGTVVLTPFGAAAAMAAAMNPSNVAVATKPEPIAPRFKCTTYETLRGLDALPPDLLFTPLDIGAHLLAYTHHSVVGTGHHRNVDGMKAVISGLIARPDDAHRIVAATGARYLVFCKGENEIAKYVRKAPASLMANLVKDRHPDWLVPEPMRPGETVQVYRIVS